MFRFLVLGSLVTLVVCGTCVGRCSQLPEEAHDPTQQENHLSVASDQHPVSRASSSCQHVRQGDDVYVKILRDGVWTGGWLPARVANVHSSGRLDLNRGHHPKGARIKPALASGIRRHHLRCDSQHSANHKRTWHERKGPKRCIRCSDMKRCFRCSDMWRRVAAQLKRSPWYSLVRMAANEKFRATGVPMSANLIGCRGGLGHQVAKAARERQVAQRQSCKWKRDCTLRHRASKRCPFKKDCESHVQERPFQKGDEVEVKVLDCLPQNKAHDKGSMHARNCVHTGRWASARVHAVHGDGASATFDLSDAHGHAIEAALPTGIQAHHLRRPAVPTSPSKTPNPQSDIVREVVEENPPRERGVRAEWANKDGAAATAVSGLNKQSVAQLRGEMERLGLMCQAGCVEKSDLVEAIMKYREEHDGARSAAVQNTNRDTRVSYEKKDVEGEKEESAEDDDNEANDDVNEANDDVDDANEEKDENWSGEESAEESARKPADASPENSHEESMEPPENSHEESMELEQHDLSDTHEGEGENDRVDDAEEDDSIVDNRRTSDEHRAKKRLKMAAREHAIAKTRVESARREHHEAQVNAQLAAAAEAKAKRAAQEQRLRHAQEMARSARTELNRDSEKLKTLEAKVKKSEKEAAALAESFRAE